MSEGVKSNKLIMDWLVSESFHCALKDIIRSIPSDFTSRCISVLEADGDQASKVKIYDKALAAYSTALSLSLSSSSQSTLLVKWARTVLTCSSVNEALDAATHVCFSQYSHQLRIDFRFRFRFRSCSSIRRSATFWNRMVGSRRHLSASERCRLSK